MMTNKTRYIHSNSDEDDDRKEQQPGNAQTSNAQPSQPANDADNDANNNDNDDGNNYPMCSGFLPFLLQKYA